MNLYWVLWSCAIAFHVNERCAFDCCFSTGVGASEHSKFAKTQQNKSISALLVHFVQMVFPTSSIAYFELLHMRPISTRCSRAHISQYENHTLHWVPLIYFNFAFYALVVWPSLHSVPFSSSKCRRVTHTRKIKCIKHITSIAPATKENICSSVYLQTWSVHSNFIHNHISLTSNSMAKCMGVSWLGGLSMDMTNEQRLKMCRIHTLSIWCATVCTTFSRFTFSAAFFFLFLV